MTRLAVSACAIAVLVAGCGSRDAFPPAAEPPASPPLTERPAGRVVPAARVPDRSGAGVRAVVDEGRAVAVLHPRERELEVRDRDGATIGRAAAGIGPTRVVGGRGGLIYVVDTAADGLLVYELRPRLHLTRRLPVLGGPYGIASDTVNQRLWITTTGTNRLVELADGARPHRLRGFPAVRQPDTVTVDPGRGRVYVRARAGDVVQILDAGDTAPRTPRTARR